MNGHEFVTYADADLAGDIGSRKSTTGFVVVLAGGLVSWMSKLQSTVALSTAEAETNASVETVKQIMHFRLFHEGARHGARWSVGSIRRQSSGIFCNAKVGTKQKQADAFTKDFRRDDFNHFRSWRSKFSNKIFSS